MSADLMLCVCVLCSVCPSRWEGQEEGGRREGEATEGSTPSSLPWRSRRQ